MKMKWPDVYRHLELIRRKEKERNNKNKRHNWLVSCDFVKKATHHRGDDPFQQKKRVTPQHLPVFALRRCQVAREPECKRNQIS